MLTADRSAVTPDLFGRSQRLALLRACTRARTHCRSRARGAIIALPDGPQLFEKDAAVIVKQVWTGNSYRNFNYLIACPETGDALAIDPLDHEKCVQAAKAAGWTVSQILNTHEHRDHTGGNGAMVQKTGAKILAHKNAKAKIP